MKAGPGDAAAELLAALVRGQRTWRPRRSRRRYRTTGGGHCRARCRNREDPGDPRPFRSRRCGRRDGRASRCADRGPAPRRRLPDREFGKTGRQIRRRLCKAVRAGPLAGRRRRGDGGRFGLRGPPLPWPHAGPCDLPSTGRDGGFRRRRVVQGLGRPLRPAAREPRAADPGDPKRTLAHGRRDHFRPLPRPALDSGPWATRPLSSPATARSRPLATSARPTPTAPTSSRFERLQIFRRRAGHSERRAYPATGKAGQVG